MLEYNNKYEDTTETDTLGNKIRFARNRMSEWCAEIRDNRLMKRLNQGLFCSKLEDPPRFGCSDKTYKYRKKFKKKRFFKGNKKYYKKNKYKNKFYKKNEGISESDSIYYLSEETLSSSDSKSYLELV